MNRTTDQAQGLREQVSRQRTPAKVITITSGKGGVGKSSMTVNLAIAINQMGRRALVVDADFGLANIDVMLGVSAQYNLSHILRGQRSLADIIQEGYGGVRFISGGSGVFDLLTMDSRYVQCIVEELMNLGSMADIVLFDTGAGVNSHIMQLVAASTEAIIVTTPEPTAILDAYALIKTINRQTETPPPISLIMNKAESRREADNATAGLQGIIKKYLNKEIIPLGCVPFDHDITRSIKRQVPIVVDNPNGHTSRSIRAIAQTILDQPVTSLDDSNPLARFFMRFLG